ncbi:MAG: hypothetical protein JWN98_326 [Abditibacteriota bacterium]|jgi:hypothetical protein|nr:hypothetical protein [Abditibacteriota bacterium]
MMSSLAQLAEATHDATLMEHVKRFYDNGLKKVSAELGWSLENASPRANTDRGEVNS